MSKLNLEQIVNQLGADSAAIMVPNDDEQHLDCFDSYNMPDEWVEIKNPYDEKVTGGNIEVYNTGQATTTNHIKRYLKGFFIESVMILPIKRNGKTIGMLELIHDRDEKTFSDKDREHADTFTKELEPLLP